MKTKILLISILTGTVTWTAAMEVGGIDLPKQQDGFELQGAGLLRKGMFFKIYVGALYLQDQNHAEDVLGPVPKRLDIHYFHHTPKKHMIRMAEKTLQQNLTSEQYEQLTPKVKLLHEAYMNGNKGSVASLIYEPGVGLQYAFDGQLVATIPGDDFANAYFTIWLGKHPGSRTIKEAMLNGESG